MPKTTESELDQTINSISKPNDTAYNIALKGYGVFTNEYNPLKELSKTVKDIM